MPSIHPSFFFPLCWLPSPVHDHYFNTSHECKSSARIQLHQLYCSQLNELRELKQKAQKVLDYCDDDSDVVMKDQASTGNSNQMSSTTGQGLARNLGVNSIHERKQPSFNDEDFVSLQEFLNKSNNEMTWEEIQKMKQSESISVNILSNQSGGATNGSRHNHHGGHVAQERSTAHQNHHHGHHHHNKSHTLPSTDWVQNVKIIEKEMKWAARYQPHRIPMERGNWLKLDTLLLREREENTQLVQNQSSKSSTSSQDFENGKRGQLETSPETCTGFKKNFQMALRLIESENELAVDQFDLVVQLCTKMIYSVVTQSPLCCSKWELENELNSVSNGTEKKCANNNLSPHMLGRIHKTILRKSEEIYWRKFIEIIFLKLIVDPKCIVVGLSYFEKVISLLENERVSSPLLKGQHDGSNKDHSLRNSFNRNELKTIMCICVMLSSKMYDEDNYWKSKTYFKLFSSLCRKREDHKRITFKEFNQLEVEILNVLQFDLTLDMDAFGRRIVQRFLKVHFDEESALLMI
ncbi:predicted protein [Naegleria gruberi]|uniref:Predicted protein n=1 Tax=Naegleria gruberi TaxID=5762 RepID=D2VNL0_NAEGR|nr:uncharacterized protein NAEGRDRAFT_51026 [Naegleria gruberi]EFC41755.1 predicted protein [Naegleria gruberi]|eukprot:XP_002674499.1 predicted protein [Naegleria gruberi strain NEG-M]